MTGGLHRPGAVAALSVACIGTALVIVASTHHSRALYAELQELEAARWYLEEEYSQLLIEQSTWASHHRIEQEARRVLRMAPPAHERMRLVPL